MTTSYHEDQNGLTGNSQGSQTELNKGRITHMVEGKSTTTFDHLMNFMTTYVQHNQVDPKDLPDVFERVKSVVFDTMNDAAEAETTEEAAPRRGRRGRQTRTLVRADASDETATAAESQEALPFLAVVGTEPAKKRGRPRKDAAAETAKPVQSSDPSKQSADPSKSGYKFAHISRIPVMDPEDAIKDDTIINLIDGVEQKMLKRSLNTKYGMTPEEYRIHFNLRPDYPVTAPNYSLRRQEIMKHTIKSRAAQASEASTPVASEEAERPRRGRPPKSASAPKANEAKAVKRARRASNEESKAA